MIGGLLAGAAAGYGIGRSGDPAPVPVSPPASRASASPAPSAAGDSPRVVTGGKEQGEELEAARRRIAALEADLSKAQAEAEELRRAASNRPLAVDPAQLAAKIETLRGNGFRAFLSPGATSDIVADLKALGPPGLDLLRGLLASEDPADRFLAAKLLEDLGDPAAVPDLRKAAADSDEQVANMASHALALMGGPEALGALRSLLEGEPGVGVRVNSLFGLARAGDPMGIQQSLAYLQDTNNSGEMRAALTNGFLVLDDPRVMPVIDHIATNLRQNEAGMRAVIAYYQRVGSAVARNRLQDLANDPALSAASRAAASAALAQ